jgi:hypothetical protein
MLKINGENDGFEWMDQGSQDGDHEGKEEVSECEVASGENGMMSLQHLPISTLHIALINQTDTYFSQ